MRTNSPSTTTSLTISRQPVRILRSAPTVNSIAASISTARMPRSDQRWYWPAVRVVEDVARDDRADAHLLAELLRVVHGAVDQLPVGGRRVRLAADQVRRGRVGRHGGDRDDQVADREVGLEPAAGADAEDALDAELDQLLDHDPGRRAAHARGLHRDRLAVERARVAEHPALGVHLADVLHERLGDVLGAQRVARQQARVGVVAGLGSQVDRHGRNPSA